jgi:hypothetical protein
MYHGGYLSDQQLSVNDTDHWSTKFVMVYLYPWNLLYPRMDILVSMYCIHGDSLGRTFWLSRERLVNTYIPLDAHKQQRLLITNSKNRIEARYYSLVLLVSNLSNWEFHLYELIHTGKIRMLASEIQSPPSDSNLLLTVTFYTYSVSSL